MYRKWLAGWAADATPPPAAPKRPMARTAHIPLPRPKRTAPTVSLALRASPSVDSFTSNRRRHRKALIELALKGNRADELRALLESLDIANKGRCHASELPAELQQSSRELWRAYAKDLEKQVDSIAGWHG